MPETPRLLFVHAHPDDESLSNGATIAHYTALGAQVRVVTCTLGEEGEVIGDRWAELGVDRADQLGGYRIGELTAALQALGVPAPIYLGGAGRWRDLGMQGTPQRRRQRFIDADEREVVGALVAIIREQRGHVVVTYDPNGGYGHPDHVHTHTVTTAAVTSCRFRSGQCRLPRRAVDGAEVLLDGLGRKCLRSGLAPAESAKTCFPTGPSRRERRSTSGMRTPTSTP